jgi:hypothetical protein
VNGDNTRRVKIEPTGDGVVAHVGLHALGAFADRVGLGDALSARIAPGGERLALHDPGQGWRRVVRGHRGVERSGAPDQARLFGAVPSDSTLYRTFRQIAPGHSRRAVGRDG